MIFLNTLNKITLFELTLQSLPSNLNLLDFQSLFQIFNDSFPLEELLLLDFIISGHNVSTFWNDALFIFASLNEELLSILLCTVLVFIFSSIYSNNSNPTLVSKILKILNIIVVVYFIYLSSFYVIRLLLIHYLNYNDQTKYWSIPANQEFFVNNEQVFANMVINLFIFSLLVAAIGLININNTTIYSPEVPILIFLVACFSWSLVGINNFGLFIICLEGFSLTLYILATAERTYGGISAAVKYFIFGTFGSILFYWGSLGIFEITATMSISNIKEFILNHDNLSNYTDNINLLWLQTFIILGFLVKLGAAPTHQWVADVYSGVSLSVTLFYATFVKAVLFILFLQLTVSLAEIKEVEYAAVLSLAIGCFGALRQVEIKRFLAYSSITHTGYLLMGDLIASYIYLVTYLLASLLFFSVLLSVKLNNKELIYLADLRFIGQASQLHRTALVISLASMAGLPPFAGFYGKMAVWISLIEDIYLFNDSWSYILFVFNILTSLVSMFYYAQVMCMLFVNNEFVNSELISLIASKNLYFYSAIITLWTAFMPLTINLTIPLLN